MLTIRHDAGAGPSSAILQRSVNRVSQSLSPDSTAAVIAIRTAGVQQRARRLRRGDLEQRPVVTVDGLGPRLDRSARGRLEDVWRAARVGER